MQNKIIAITTDPYDAIYGYALVFFKFFNYLDTEMKDLNIVFASNDGTCSRLIKNPNFIIKKIPNNINLLTKTFLLSLFFIRIGLKNDKTSIVVANCEIPELLAAYVLKFRNRRVFCLLQDDQVRNASLFTKLVCGTRILLMKQINNVIFTNKFTMDRFEDSVNKYYLGNPIFKV